MILRLKEMATRVAATETEEKRNWHLWRTSIAVDREPASRPWDPSPPRRLFQRPCLSWGELESGDWGNSLRHSMKDQIETRIAKLLEAVKRATLEDSAGRARAGDALDRLVDAIEVVLLLVNAFEENTHDKIYFKDLQSRFIYVSKSYSMAFGGLIESVGKTVFDAFTAEHAQAAFEDDQQVIRHR